MGPRQIFILGTCLIVAAIAHSVAATLLSSRAPQPVREGYAVGSMVVREKDYLTELKCNGCKVECFDRFVVVYLDRTKEPTWTDNYVKVVPWEKIEYLTLLPQR